MTLSQKTRRDKDELSSTIPNKSSRSEQSPEPQSVTRSQFTSCSHIHGMKETPILGPQAFKPLTVKIGAVAYGESGNVQGVDRNMPSYAILENSNFQGNCMLDLSRTFPTPDDSIPISHQGVAVDSFTAGRFYTLSDISFHYESHFPEIFDSPHHQGEHLVDHDHDIDYGAPGEIYDTFEDDFLWKDIARKDFYIPWNSNPSSQTLQVEQGRTTSAKEPKMEYRYDCVKGSHVFTKDKGSSGAIATPPTTLVPPMSRISVTNARKPVNPPTRRILTFATGSWRLARISECLAVLGSLGDGNKTPVLSPITNVTATKWLHLPVGERRKPFARLPPPQAVQQRSSIEGLGTKTIIRVCFRVGEAVRFANTASCRCGDHTNVIIELFGLYPECCVITLD